MSEILNIGLIGAGRIAKVHAVAYKSVQGARLVACADIAADAANAFAAEHELDAYIDYRELLAREDIDAVIIATPNGLHPEHMIAAANAGKHVFCQKPIALTLADADRMIQTAADCNIILQVGFMLRFTPPIPHLRQLISAGELGEIIAIRAAIFGWEPNSEWFYIKEQGGGVILDTLIHFADLIRDLAGDVESVHAEGGAYVLDNAKKHESPDNATVTYRHANRAVSSLYVTWTSGYGNFLLEVYGAKGNYSVNLLEKQTSALFLKEDSQTHNAGWSYPDLVWSYGYAGEQQYFVNQILGKEPRGQASGADGRSALDMVLKAQASLDSGRILKFENQK